MHPLGWLRTIPPGGAPLGLDAIAHAVALARNNAPLEKLEALVQKRFEAEHVFFTSSGRGALALLFAALRKNNPERDQVLIPAYVSYSVPSAVVRAGCRVSLYDLNPESLTPNLESLRQAISERTLAVLAAHQFGLPFDLAGLEAICRESGAVLVDDAAQVMGASVNGKACGMMGDAGIFSLSRGKPITAVEGGILITKNAGIAGQIQRYRAELGGADDATSGPASTIKLFIKAVALSLLRRPELYTLPASMPWLKIGASIFDPNFGVENFTAFQAGLALASLERLDEINEGRIRKAALYNELLKGEALAAPSSIQPGAKPVYLRYPLLPASGWPQDKPLHAALAKTKARKLGISPGFPQAICDVPQVAAYINGNNSAFDGARLLARNLVTLPTHNQVRGEDAREAVKIISKALSQGAKA